jgi:hypothetical protein
MLVSQRSWFLAGVSASASLLVSASGCNDLTTGQPDEPSGPLQVIKLTLFDASGRDQAVFTDTSIPDCSPVVANMVDCTQAPASDTNLCRICYNDVFKDKYSPIKSPPNPDSGSDIRVVFNKEALNLGGQPLGFSAADAMQLGQVSPEKAAALTCKDCAGVPKLNRFLWISGSDVSFDPTITAYGPSVQLKVDTTDPRAALEPGSHYAVTVDPGLSGRDGNAYVATAEQTALLSFQTEAFSLLRVGRGAAKDAWVYAKPSTTAYTIADQPRDAAVVLRLNAPVFASAIAGMAVSATQSGGGSVAAKLLANAKSVSCKPDSQRLVYIFPTSGSWPTATAQVDIRIPSGTITDVAQDGSFGKGKHSYGSDINVTVKFTDMPTTTSYTKVADVITAGNCP